ncbi:recombinase family protein [Anatilimnocola floriformis]|uniref:recombinase family protein n=1 Tax=Anatilimnocola floriformis TaxID=2948575 RepID=UPI0020C44F58|nr:recombinase family protein [Anatilimnocola floriformis]
MRSPAYFGTTDILQKLRDKLPVRNQNEGLIYIRRSSNRQEASMETQLNWALQQAADLKVHVDASIKDLHHMLACGMNSYKSLRIDDAVTGSDLNRTGFCALLADATKNKSISHIFAYRRDRLARPEDASEMMSLERRVREAGVTLVLSNRIAPPRERGRPDIADDMQMYVEYYQSGEFLIALAERVLDGHRNRAMDGFRTGGVPPYGFIRVLVDSNGKELEELPKGKVVRQPGCHVRIKPKDEAKIRVWLLILELKHQGWGGKRIANHLNKASIPSPNAGRTRKDQGVRHYVTGKWNHTTVLDLCDNAAIIGMQDYGKRSEGKFRRFDGDKHRILNESDRLDENAIRLVKNSDEKLIKRSIQIEPLYDPAKWQEIQRQTEERGKSQRGIPRAKDLTKYPLSTRVVDLTDGCGAIMYGREHGGKRVYVCSRYMRTSGSDCSNNEVDGEALLAMATGYMRQLIDVAGGREKIRKRLEQFVDAGPPQAALLAQNELAGLEIRKSQLQRDLQMAGRNFALAPDDQIRQMVTQQIAAINTELADVDACIRESSLTVPHQRDVDGGVEAAMHLLDQFKQVLADPNARQQLIDIIKLMNMRAGLNFVEGIKGKKRKVRRLAGGALYFGSTPYPIPLHGKDNCQHSSSSEESRNPAEDSPAELPKSTKAVGGEDITSPPTASVDVPLCRHEGVSFTKVSRGDRI